MEQTFGAFVRQKRMEQGLSLRRLAARQVLCGYDSELYYGSPSAVPIEEIIESHGVSLEYQYLRKNGSILGKTVFDRGLEAVYDMENHESENDMEVQANMLGSAILMPIAQIKRCFYQLRQGGVVYQVSQVRVTDRHHFPRKH